MREIEAAGSSFEDASARLRAAVPAGYTLGDVVSAVQHPDGTMHLRATILTPEDQECLRWEEEHADWVAHLRALEDEDVRLHSVFNRW